MGKTEKPQIEVMRHSLSHIMAMAVLELMPEARLAIGPAIENGFYYDFDLPRTLTPEDLPEIEETMKRIIATDAKFQRREEDAKKAYKVEEKKGEIYKAELIADLISDGTKKVSFYRSGEFEDLCAGPHVTSSNQLRGVGFKLTKIAGAYWRGDEKNKMLQRIYAVAFESPKELRTYLANQAEAEKRDHRKLGAELDLFSIPEEIGGGLPIWHPKGAALRQVVEDFWKKVHRENGYEYVYTPHIGNINLWKKSGHWDFYRENLYSPMEIDDQEYLIKPMNCPFHIMIYQSQMRSYRDLPLRYCELGTVYRYERSGVLHGLTRVRGFTQDDAHIFCREEQLEKEIIDVLKMVDFMMKRFGFKYKAYLSTKPEKAIGTDKNWKQATGALENALSKTKTEYTVDPGEGVFYGPKIDVKLQDALGREWQGPTVQVDFNFPDKFDVTYVDKDGNKKRPVMVHRTVLGSMERFIGVLIEHYAGEFPFWLAPTQIAVASVAKPFNKYAKEVHAELAEAGYRVTLDDGNETVGKKIRAAEMQKIPYILVVGEKEMKSKSVAIRMLHDKNIIVKKLSAFIKELET